jgi:hypothetical protein
VRSIEYVTAAGVSVVIQHLFSTNRHCKVYDQFKLSMGL